MTDALDLEALFADYELTDAQGAPYSLPDQDAFVADLVAGRACVSLSRRSVPKVFDALLPLYTTPDAAIGTPLSSLLLRIHESVSTLFNMMPTQPLPLGGYDRVRIPESSEHVYPRGHDIDQVKWFSDREFAGFTWSVLIDTLLEFPRDVLPDIHGKPPVDVLERKQLGALLNAVPATSSTEMHKLLDRDPFIKAFIPQDSVMEFYNANKQHLDVVTEPRRLASGVLFLANGAPIVALPRLQQPCFIIRSDWGMATIHIPLYAEKLGPSLTSRIGFLTFQRMSMTIFATAIQKTTI